MARVAAIDCCSCRHHERSRRCRPPARVRLHERSCLIGDPSHQRASFSVFVSSLYCCVVDVPTRCQQFDVCHACGRGLAGVALVQVLRFQDNRPIELVFLVHLVFSCPNLLRTDVFRIVSSSWVFVQLLPARQDTTRGESVDAWLADLEDTSRRRFAG